MKNNIIAACLAIFLAGFIFSCQKDARIDSENSELTGFMESTVFNDFKNNFPKQYEKLNYNYLLVEQPTSDVKTLIIPVENDNKAEGKLVGFYSIAKKDWHIMYEDYSELDMEKGGKIELYTARKNFIVELNAKIENEKVKFSYGKVGMEKYEGRDHLREWPTSEDGWWTCTTECYDIIDDICDDDPECDVMCTIIDIASTWGACTVSIAASCGIYCTGVSD